ncbi:hypothetical protein BJV78DRAFT_1280468 [Lactifluus subvellereus]|nr:hypothetical protein BJV78DRAFT_1280468 [Lactifluus subvellereus]
MLRSTVTTGSYTLEKYSRSYPSRNPAQTHSQDLPVRQPEWQHFVNPVITLTLDVKKSMDNSFESVRLRIIWNTDVGNDQMQREITMEDLDLLSFSRVDGQIHSGQGPPLKAVYRGAIVGIRYQYPVSVPATSPTSYRRFQVNFASSSDAVKFIDAIRPVCPCKENAGPPPPQIPTNRPSMPMMSNSTSIQAPSTSAPLFRYHTSTVQWPSMPPPSVGATSGSAERNAPHPSSQREHPQRPPQFPPSSSSDLSLAPPTSDLIPPYPMTAPPPETYSNQFTVQSGGGVGGRRNSASSLPALSQPPTSTAATLAPPTQTTITQPPGAATAEKTREAFLESLRETPGLYSLTRPELENLVSVVVREPGFPRLLEALESMWAIRGFLGQ